MKFKPFVLLGLLLAGVFWIAESAIHTFVFHQDTFVQNLFPYSPNEVWMRFFIAILFTSFGFIAQSLSDKRVNAEAKRGEEQFKLLVNSSPEAIGVHRNGKLIYANAATLKLLGATKQEEIIWQPLLSFVHPDDREEANKRIQQTIEDGKSSYRVEERLIKLNGDSFMAEITSIPVEFDGTPAVMLVCRDIDERKFWECKLESSLVRVEAAENETEAARKREQEQSRILERFYQHTHECIVLLDRDFNFIRVNQAYADACKRDIKEFPGHNHFEFYPSPIIDDFKKVVATGIPYQVYSRPFVFPEQPELGVTYWDLSLVPITEPDSRIELLLFTLNDVTDRHRAESALTLTNRALRIISTCNSLLVHSNNEAKLLDDMCRLIVKTNEYCFAWVGYADDDEQKTVRPQAQSGNEAGLFAKAHFSWADDEYGRGPTGTAIRTSRTAVVHNIKTIECHSWCEHALECGYASAIALPLCKEEKTYGTLTIYATEPDVFKEEEVELLEQLAADLSFGIVNLRSGEARKRAEEQIVAYVKQLEESMYGTLQAVSNMVEQRDPYTAGHERRVGIIAADIAQEMGWPEKKCNDLKMIGLVHDIGKISTPAEILSKPGRLTPSEYSLVKDHVEKGYEILKDVKFPLPIAKIIRQHHERMDGSGYPFGLKGPEILPEARILAVADVLESMASHRPYRPALGIEVALKEIFDHRETLYDASVVDALLKMVREKGYQLPT